MSSRVWLDDVTGRWHFEVRVYLDGQTEANFCGHRDTQRDAMTERDAMVRIGDTMRQMRRLEGGS